MPRVKKTTTKKIKKPREKTTKKKVGARAKKEPKKEKKEEKEEKKLKPEVQPPRYFESVGRRKTAAARVRLLTKEEKAFLVNEKPYDIYFPTLELQQIAAASLNKMKCLGWFRILAKVRGGGLHAQAEAIRHGIARALVLFNPEFKKRLKKAGYLTRDPRMRERKKFGLRRARRAPQWQKR